MALGILAYLAFPSPAAASCGRQGSLTDAHTAFIGRVLSVQERRQSGYVFATSTVEVQRTLKGAPGNEVRVETIASRTLPLGETLDEAVYDLEEGAAYGFALSAPRPDGTYRIHTYECGENGITSPEALEAAFAKGRWPLVIGAAPAASAVAVIASLYRRHTRPRRADQLP